jgi:hypothetical protein
MNPTNFDFTVFDMVVIVVALYPVITKIQDALNLAGTLPHLGKPAMPAGWVLLSGSLSQLRALGRIKLDIGHRCFWRPDAQFLKHLLNQFVEHADPY